ncbi:MAG TPA: hypothetical protein VGO80_10725 [Solirubrobacteraceae bacterium]|jgi:hypothetical protein|nr:hypothetical protein [Solirubrobacteraceae bacterium]
MPDTGILYVATGERHQEETRRSASSFKVTMPDVPVAIFTDDPPAARAAGCFDIVRELSDCRHSYVDKLRPLVDSPFERTLFLDTDTYSAAPCYEVFDLLDRFDLAIAHAPLRAHFHHPLSCPISFPELNTGVIAYRNTRAFRALVANWIEIFASQPDLEYDQPAFREALYVSDLRFAVLTSEYNLRACFPYFLGGNVEVKIIHARDDCLDEAIASLRAAPMALLPRVVAPETLGASAEAGR